VDTPRKDSPDLKGERFCEERFARLLSGDSLKGERALNMRTFGRSEASFLRAFPPVWEFLGLG